MLLVLACGDDDAGQAPDASTDAASPADASSDTGADAAPDSAADAAADAEAEPPPDPSDEVFALDVLHRVELTIDPLLFDQLDRDHEVRVPATIDYDGITLEEVGIRVKCGIGSCTTIADKVSFSVRFDELVPGQELLGLEKLILNAEIQDRSYSNELLGQELARRSGIPAKRVAYAEVFLNGDPYGLFVVVEAVDKEFLRRHFGEGNDEGNLYEGECCGDFVWDPFFPELKREEEEGRSRDDIASLAEFIAGTADGEFSAGIGDRIDLARYLTGYAIVALTYHWDSYEYNANNYYLYDDPGSGRFVFWLHGMDQLFSDCGWAIGNLGPGRLGQRILENPDLDAAFRSEIARILDEVWDEAELLAFLDDAVEVYEDAARADPRHPLDEWRLAAVRHCLIDRPTAVRAQLAAVCGNGEIEANEECDDGNVRAGDGCSALCRSECGNGDLDGDEECDDGNRWEGDGCSAWCTLEPGCGDGLVQPELGEQCDDGADGDNFSDGCRDDCTENRCGDGLLDAGEECDDGNELDGDGCTAACDDEDGFATCGNGVLEIGEQCDDGNLLDGDACDPGCMRPCPEGGVVAGLNGHCYVAQWLGLDWFEARDDCETRGGHLVTVGSRAENDIASSVGGGWIGLSDLDEEGSFAWITGEPYTWDGFAPGEPNDWGAGEDCVELVADWSAWNDLDCAARIGHLCEIE